MTNLFDLLKENNITTIEAKSEDLLNNFKLNWEVSKQPLFLSDGTKTEYYGVVRQDTKRVFTTVKDDYEVFSNLELLDLVNTSANKLGIELTKGGSFKQGALVYLQLSTGIIDDIGENHDKINKFITAINSHNGSTSLRWGFSNITISCQNTFWKASGQLTNIVKHTRNMKVKIDSIVKEIQKIQKEEESIYEIYFKLAEAPIRKENISKVVELVFDVDIDNTKPKDLTTFQKNKIDLLSSCIKKETFQKGQTLWGLFSGVTNFTTHFISDNKATREQIKAIGRGNRIDNKVFQNFANLVK